MRSGNPVLNDSTFDTFNTAASYDQSQRMTLSGTVLKTGFLLSLAMAAAFVTWGMVYKNPQLAMPLTIGGAVAGLVLALITTFKQTWSPVTAPLYAIVEGFFLGGISALYNSMFDGIVLQAIMLTFGTMFALLTAYQSGLIRATENFKLGVTAATGGIMLAYLAVFVLGFFNIRVPFIHDAGPIGIGISAFIVVIAALNLVLDFDFIENGVKAGAPKYMEWYAGFSLMVTLVWLYLEILRLLSKLQSRD